MTWDADPDSEKGTAAEIARRAVERARPRSIIVLHVMYPSRTESFNSVPIIVRDLKERGFEILTVSELIGAKDR